LKNGQGADNTTSVNNSNGTTPKAVTPVPTLPGSPTSKASLSALNIKHQMPKTSPKKNSLKRAMNFDDEEVATPKTNIKFDIDAEMQDEIKNGTNEELDEEIHEGASANVQEKNTVIEADSALDKSPHKRESIPKQSEAPTKQSSPRKDVEMESSKQIPPKETKKQGSKAMDVDEVDPLDAFMIDVTSEVTRLDAEDNKLAKRKNKAAEADGTATKLPHIEDDPQSSEEEEDILA